MTRDRSGFFDLVAQLRRRWAVVLGGGLLGLIVGVALAQAVPGEGIDGASPAASLVILLVAVLAGLALGFSAGLVMVHLQPRVTTADDVRRVTGLPVVAQLPSGTVDADDYEDRVTTRRVRTALREAVMNTRSLAGGELPRRLVIARTDTDAEAGGVDGGIARALVDSGFVPALVHTDLEARMLVRPSTVDFDADVVGGVLGVDRPRHDPAGYQRIPVPDRVTSSRPQTQLAEVSNLLDALGERYDVTVAQSSSNSFPVPLRALAPVADGVLLVVRSNRTTVDSLLALYGELLSIGVEPLGVVMTAVAPRHRVLLRRTWVPSDFRSGVVGVGAGARVAAGAGARVAAGAGAGAGAAAVGSSLAGASGGVAVSASGGASVGAAVGASVGASVGAPVSSAIAPSSSGDLPVLPARAGFSIADLTALMPTSTDSREDQP